LISILRNPTERTDEAVNCKTVRQPDPGRWRHVLPLLLLLLCVLLSSCEIWSLEKGLRQIRHGIQEAEGLEMEEAALYHLKVARSLLEAAEKQYEQADFPAAEQFLDQSESQLQRARRLHTMSGSAPPQKRNVYE
jgi:hypothetical protein